MDAERAPDQLLDPVSIRAAGLLVVGLALACEPQSDSDPAADPATVEVGSHQAPAVYDDPSHGVRIVEVDPALEAHRSGLREGDVVLQWRVSGQTWQDLSSPYHLTFVEQEVGAFEPVELRSRRGDGARAEVFEVVLGQEHRSPWGARAAPPWNSEFSGHLEAVLGEIDAVAGSAKSSADFEPRLNALLTAKVRSVDAAWFWEEAAQRAVAANQSPQTYESAAEEACRESDDAHCLRLVVHQAGVRAQARRETTAAEARFEQAAELLPDASSQDFPSQFAALVAWRRAENALLTGRVEDARHHFEECERQATLHETTRLTGRCRIRQGQVHILRGDLDGAERCYLTGLEMLRDLAPRSVEVSSGLNGLAMVAMRKGDVEQAMSFFEEALDIVQALEEDQLIAQTQFNLGVVYSEQGDQGRAEALYLQALETFREIAPDSLEVSYAYNNLANVARIRGEFDAAVAYSEKALELRERLVPDSQQVALTLASLAGALKLTGEYERAAEALRRSLEIADRVAPNSLLSADAQSILGEVFIELGQYSSAERELRAALATRVSIAPDDAGTAITRTQLARALIGAGRFADAQPVLRRSIAALERVAPGTAWIADAHYTLARSYLGLGDRRSALRHFRQAVADLESQGGRLGQDARGVERFRQRFARNYQDLIELEVELGELQAAFETTERFRARALIAMLASRELSLDADLPEPLAQDYRGVLEEYEALRAQWSTEATPTLTLVGQRAALEERLAGLQSEIEEVAPKYSAFTNPRPLPFSRLAANIEDGTLLLSYVALADHYVLFVLDSQGRLDVHRLPGNLAEVEREVDTLLVLASAGASEMAAPNDSLEVAEAVYRRLLSPAQQRIESARRLSLSPDGSLHHVPWAALARRDGEGVRYLVEDVALHVVPSLSVAAQMQGEGLRQPAGEVVVFADPAIDRTSDAEPAAERSEWSPLPWAREEAKAIRSVYRRRARIWTGAEATEAQLEQVSPTVSVLHFASHARVDHRRPLESALVLAEGAGEDGLLHAWEVFEGLRLAADLVVLSGCDTGGGAVVDGEGLIGLTRAFQYAGASAVVATQWRVADRSMSHLMARFHHHRAEGLSSDEALRRAQVEALRGEDHRGWFERWFGGGDETARWKHPYHWAGVQLYGDSR